MSFPTKSIRKLSLLLLVSAMSAVSMLAFPGPAKADQIEDQIPDVIGIEYLFTAPNGGPIYSRFGHALLRLVNPKISPEKNLVISLAAQVADNDVNYVKGVTGGYKLTLSALTLEQASIQYNFGTNQNIDRYVLALRTSDLKMFLNCLQYWLKNPSEMGDYTFLSNNCAGALSRLFKEAGIQIDHTSLPSHLSDEFSREGISPFPALRMASAALSWQPIESALGMSQQEWVNTRSLSTEQIQKILKDAGPVALARILYRNLSLDRDTQSRLRAALSPYFDQLDFDDLIDIRTVPSILYQAPESPADFDAINTVRREFFGKTALKSDLDFLTAMSFESEMSEYKTLEVRRIQADKTFTSVEIAHGLEGLTSSSMLQLAYDEGELHLVYLTKDSVRSASSEQSVKISGQISADGKSIQFGNVTCSLAASPTGLGDDCSFTSTRTGFRRSVSVVGLK